jgi:hypothetical protein
MLTIPTKPKTCSMSGCDNKSLVEKWTNTDSGYVHTFCKDHSMESRGQKDQEYLKKSWAVSYLVPRIEPSKDKSCQTCSRMNNGSACVCWWCGNNVKS